MPRKKKGGAKAQSAEEDAAVAIQAVRRGAAVRRQASAPRLAPPANDDPFGMPGLATDDDPFGMGPPPGVASSFEPSAPPDFGGGMTATDFGELSTGPVAQWRIDRDERVSARAAAAREAEGVVKASAKSALEQFYAERQAEVVKRAAANRDDEKRYVSDRDAAMVADSWESVTKLVDMKEKAGQEYDVSRMRQILSKHRELATPSK